MIPHKLLTIARVVAAVIAPPQSSNAQATYNEGDANMQIVLTGTSSYSTIQSFRIESVPATGTLKHGTTVLTAGSIVMASGNTVTLTFEPTSADYYGSVGGNFRAIDAQGLESSQYSYLILVNQAPRPSTANWSPVYSYAGDGNTVEYTFSGTPYNSQPQNAIVGFKITNMTNTHVGTLTDINGNALTIGSIVPITSLNSARVLVTQHYPEGTVGYVTGQLNVYYSAVSQSGYEDLTPTGIPFIIQDPRPSATNNIIYGSEGQTSFTGSSGFTGERPTVSVRVEITPFPFGTVTIRHNGVIVNNGDVLPIDSYTNGYYMASGFTYDVVWTEQNAYGGIGLIYLYGIDDLGREGAGTWHRLSLGAVNDIPVVTSGTFSGNNEVTISASISASDIDSNLGYFTIHTAPIKGTLKYGTQNLVNGSVISTGNVTSRTINLTYTANEGEFGTDSFTYSATDVSNAQSDIATVTINVAEVVYPTTNNVSVSGYSDEVFNITMTGADTQTQVDSFKIKSVPVDGVLYNGATALVAGSTVTAVSNAASITYVPSIGFGGVVTFTYAAVSGTSKEDKTPATGTLTVTQAQFPVTENATVSGNQDTSINVNVTGTVANGIVAQFKVTALPSYGSLTFGGNPVVLNQTVTATGQAATFVYTPNAGFYGSDVFTYSAISDSGRSDATPATATITVNQVVPPDTIDETTATYESVETYFYVYGTAASGTVTQFKITSLPTNGVLKYNGTAVALNDFVPASGNKVYLSYMPNASYSGPDSFTIASYSSQGVIDPTPATVSITVNSGIEPYNNTDWDKVLAQPYYAENDLITDNRNAVIGTNALSQVAGRFGGKAIQFGGSAFLRWSSPTKSGTDTFPFAMVGDFTIEMNVYFNTVPAGANWYIMDFGSNGQIIRLYQNTIKQMAGSTTQYDSGFLPAAGQWYHFAFVRRGTSFTMYVDGVSRGTGTVSSDMRSSTVTLGNYGGGGGYSPDMRVDNFRMSAFAKYTTAFTPPASDFKYGTEEANADPHFANVSLLIKETSGSTPIDSSNSPLTISASGNASIVSNQTRFGGGVLRTNAAGNLGAFSVINAPGITLGNATSFTVEFYFYQATGHTSASTQVLIAQGAAVNSAIDAWSLALSSTRLLMFRTTSGTTLNNILTSAPAGSTVTLDRWHHIAVVRQGNLFYVYLNGGLVAMVANSAVFNSPTTNITIGNDRNLTATYKSDAYFSNVRITKGVPRYTSVSFTPRLRSEFYAGTGSVPAGLDPYWGNVTLSIPFIDSVTSSPYRQVLEPSVGSANVVLDSTRKLFTQSTLGFPTGSGNGNGITLTSYGRSVLGSPIANVDFTIEAWVQSNWADGTVLPILAQTTSSANASQWLFGVRSGAPVFQSGTGTFLTGTSITDAQFHHVAVVRSGGTLYMYIDGVLRAQQAHTAAITSSADMKIGLNPLATITTGFRLNISRLRVTAGVARYLANFTPDVNTIAYTSVAV